MTWGQVDPACYHEATSDGALMRGATNKGYCPVTRHRWE